MVNRIKVTSLVFAIVLAMVLIAGCSKDNKQEDPSVANSGGSSPAKSEPASNPSPTKVDEIYFLNFKPEISEVYDKIAKDYEAESGVKLKVVTAAAGTYEATLKAEIAKSNPPTIFQINGPVGYDLWKDYTADLKDTKLYSFLSDKSLAVTDGDGVYGIPYVVEGFGIIYNDAIMEEYFQLSNKAVNIQSADEINNFATLKAVVEDMTANIDKLGIQGVFASTSFAAGEDWRWQTHLVNMPLYYEFKEIPGFGSTITAGLSVDEISLKYADQYKNIFDLYLNNSITKSSLLSAKSVDDSMAEFALGQVAMVQNGNWAWSQIDGVAGNTVQPDNIKFMPIYMGAPGEEQHGIAIGTENYFSINGKVSPEKQEASAAFLEWLFSSETGKQYVTGDLGFIAPFNTFDENEKPSDPLAREVIEWMNKGKTSVEWSFKAFPSKPFKYDLGDNLLQYVQGSVTWDQVIQSSKEVWKHEKANIIE